MLDFLNDEGREPKENEYIGTDGLIYCSVCNKPKQSITECNTGTFKHKTQCDCERKQAEEEAERYNRIERQQRIEKLTKRCFGNNQILPRSTFENSEINSTAVKLCFNYCENWQEMKAQNVNMILCGNVGSGKTYLACCICNKIISDFQASARFITEYDFLNRYMASDSKNAYINELANCSLLVFDDFGTKCFNKGKSNGFLTYINDLIDARYKNGKPVIITTNLSKDMFLNNHSVIEEQRIFSRLREMAGRPIEIKKSDLRVSRADAKTDCLKNLLKEGENGQQANADEGN